MVTSGLIAAAIGVAVTVGLSLVMPPPWELSRAIVCVAIAGFMGAAVGFSAGHAAGRREEE
jgi:hypothetical protein